MASIPTSTQELVGSDPELPKDSEPSGGAGQGNFVVYRRRWLMLALYVLLCICNAMQWIQYSIIAGLIVDYYNVGYGAVNWTSIVWMVVYIVLIFPATWLLNKKGLRFVILLGQALNCGGAWLKVFSVRPDLFALSFTGQTVVSMAQVFTLGTPAPVAATWFGPEQVSTATAIGVFGLMVGNALGSVLPPLLVKEGHVEQGLSTMFLSVAIFCTIVLAIFIFFLKDKPPTPPSAAQAQRPGRAGVDLGGETPRDFALAVWRLLRQPNLCFLTLAYGISVGVFSAILTYLEQMIVKHYPENGAMHAGNLGATFIICGLTGAIVCGALLDKTRKYKEMCLVLYALSCLGSIGMTLLLGFTSPISTLYVICAIIGFVMIGYLPSGFEFGAELTYPAPEATSGSLLSLSSQVLALTFTLVYAAILPYGTFASNGAMCVALVVGTIASALTKSDLRRQRAEEEAKAARSALPSSTEPPGEKTQ